MASQPKIAMKLILAKLTCDGLLKNPEAYKVYPSLIDLRDSLTSKVREIMSTADTRKKQLQWEKQIHAIIERYIERNSGTVEGVPVEWCSEFDGMWFRIAVIQQLLDDASCFKSVSMDELVHKVVELESSFLACYPVFTKAVQLYKYATLELDDMYNRLMESA